MKSGFRRLFVRLLTVILVLNSFVGLAPTYTIVRAQDKRVIIVNAEQPNVWTLEQAHYLLAQMHRRNLDLRAKSLEDLDPNEIAGLRFDVMRMLIEFGATFNQADLASNRLLSRNQEFNAQRREELISERDRLRRESLRLTGEIDDLETEKVDAESEEEKKRIDAKIASRKARHDKVDKEIEFLDGELGTLNAPSGQLKATEGGATFDPNRLPKSVFDKAFEDAAAKQIERFNDAPKINASLKLENFLQMQYEIIAKQLTLLRDEVGPGERLLFLELPQTVNVAHHESDKKWAQSWWRIAGYTKKTSAAKAEGEPCYKFSEGDPRKRNCRPDTTSKKVDEILTLFGVTTRTSQSSGELEYIDLDKQSPQITIFSSGQSRQSRTVPLNDQSVRTVELIPRQSSLNVNDMKLQVRSGAFNFVLSTLFGFGSRLNVQRQREQFSQFVQQELYSSAFGKGAREFGWTFTPMPGTDRLLSGVRTTYAVVVVPEEATSLVLESNGCYFPRSAYQPNNFADTLNGRWNVSDRTSRNCGDNKAFIVPIPVAGDGSSDFWVRGISYQPVPKSKRIVVLISGANFSSQIGVLVNGVPLAQSVGLAQPLIRDDSKAGADALRDLSGEKVRGRIERIDANKIVFSFEIEDFEGIPTITLVAPGKAIDINWLENVTINGKDPATLSQVSENLCGRKPAPCVERADWMFGKRPQTQDFRIDDVEIFNVGSGLMKALIHGAGFRPAPPPAPMPPPVRRLYINGISQPFAAISPELIEVAPFPVLADDEIQVTLVYGEDTIQSQPIPNPARMKIDKVTVVSYEPASEKRPGVLVVRIEGMGFNGGLEASPSKVRVNVTSSTEAFLTIPNPSETEVVTLRNPVTHVSVSTVVARKPPK